MAEQRHAHIGKHRFPEGGQADRPQGNERAFESAIASMMFCQTIRRVRWAI
jgi:hypothetical protein